MGYILFMINSDVILRVINDIFVGVITGVKNRLVTRVINNIFVSIISVQCNLLVLELVYSNVYISQCKINKTGYSDIDTTGII